jgi:hypothetical protein
MSMEILVRLAVLIFIRQVEMLLVVLLAILAVLLAQKLQVTVSVVKILKDYLLIYVFHVAQMNLLILLPLLVTYAHLTVSHVVSRKTIVVAV